MEVGFCLLDLRTQSSDEIRWSPLSGPKTAQAGSNFVGLGPGCGLGAAHEAGHRSDLPLGRRGNKRKNGPRLASWAFGLE